MLLSLRQWLCLLEETPLGIASSSGRSLWLTGENPPPQFLYFQNHRGNCRQLPATKQRQGTGQVPLFTCAAPGAALGQPVTLASPWPARGSRGGEDRGHGLGWPQGALEGFAGVPP